MNLRMESKHFLVALGLLVVCLIVAIEANEDRHKQLHREQQHNKTSATKIDKQPVAKKSAKPTEVSAKLRPVRSLSSVASGDGGVASKLGKLSSSVGSQRGDLVTAAGHEKKYMLVKKKPKHKKIKMEVFKPKMKYKKIKMKVPVKKMKKKKVKGYLVKKEHGHHGY